MSGQMISPSLGVIHSFGPRKSPVITILSKTFQTVITIPKVIGDGES